MNHSPHFRLPRSGNRARCRGKDLVFLLGLLMMLLVGSADSLAQSCGNAACRTTSILLNTGLNHVTDQTYNDGVFDSWWGIESDQDANTTESRRASVMLPYPGWPSRANAKWDWRDFLSSDPLVGSTVYYTQFEACNAGVMTLNLSVIAPDGGTVSLNGNNLFVVAPGLGATNFVSGVPVVQGINTLRVTVNNNGSPAVALNLIGTISSGANNLIARECGPFKNGISIDVYDDLNQDGFQDEGEPGIGGVQLILTNTSGDLSTYSTGNGRGWFEVGVGEVTIEPIPPAGWYVVTGTSQTVALPISASAVGIKIGFTTCPTIQVLKYNDRNCNGKQDTGEEGLPGWTIIVGSTTAITQGNTITGIKVCGATSVTVSEVIPTGSCWVQTQPGGVGTYTIPIVPGKAFYKAFFGNSSTGTLCVTKFNDIDGDGQWDNGEPGLPNWTFTVTSATLNRVVQTGPDGRVCIDVTCGTYRVCEVLQAGWCPTTPACRTVVVTACTQTDVFFGNTQRGGICVHKFNDRNCNGHQEDDEENLSGWTFTITNATVSVSVTTGTMGVTCATLPPGTYRVCEVPQPGWGIATTACCPSLCTTVTITACETKTVTFGNASTGTICAFKYNDIDEDGNYDPTIDTPLANWTIEILDNVTLVTVATGVTDASGFVCFELPLGWYRIREVQQPGWHATEPVPPVDTYLEQVTPCCSILVLFGNHEYNCDTVICVHKYNDRNCNGVQEADEESLPNWEFTISNGATTITVTTGTMGVTCATVTGGTWTVCEVTRAGWGIATTACCPSMCTTVTVSTCGVVTVTFANASTGTICVFKYEDVDGDGSYDPSIDLPLANWTMEVIDNVTLVTVATGTTDASGFVCFELPLGWYRVREVQQSGWTQTEPVLPVDTYLEEVTPCCSIFIIFGNYKNPTLPCTGTICVRKFNDINCNGVQDPGEAPLPGWTFTVTNGAATVSITTGIAGVTCATVTTGTWTVCEILQPGWTPTTPVCRTVTVTCGSAINLLYGNSTSGTICITKFNDRNCNGVRDPGEPVIPGWTFQLMRGTAVVTVVTNSAGVTCATVPAGTWTVCELLQPGWVNTTPVCRTVVLATCNTVNLLYGNSTSGTICITKFNDRNCNGVRDPGEPVLPGWTFQLSSGATVVTVVTNSAGVTCATVPAGVWTVCEIVQPGWVPTTPPCRTIVLTTCNTVNLLFGNSTSGTICMTKFNDRNCNGIQDPGEPVIPGWTFQLSSGATVVTVVTNSAGITCATVPAGTWTVCEIVQPGWTPTTPPCRTIILAPCQTVGLAFGNSTTGTLCIVKFNDINCNGIQDPGEPLVPNWPFTITTTTGTVVATVTTPATGALCIPITAGNYIVCEGTLPCWTPTTPACLPVTVHPCTDVAVVFGNSSTGTLCVFKFNDINCNGVQDAGEPPIQGWNFTVTRPDGTTFNLITGTAGRACALTTCGTYTICEELRPCWVPTTPECLTVTVVPCQTVTATFGNSSTGTLCVFKFNDVNCNGVQDPGEPPIQGWNFAITRPDGTIFNLITGTNGRACALATCGTYVVCEEQRTCWAPTTPVCLTVTVVPCQTVTAVFGNSSTGTLCILKFEDLNGNGVQDPGEPALAGWQFNVPGIGIVTTGADGMVCVPMTCGTYTVCEILQPGWVNTTPLCQTVTVFPCLATRVAFGNRKICTGTICIRKFNDINCNGVVDPGEPAIPNWTFTITNGLVSVVVTTDQTGTTCATVTTGTWTVCETLKPGWINTLPLCQTVTLTCTDNFANFVFTNSSTGTLCIRKFNDVNCNGIQDAGEPLIPNWPFTIMTTTGTVLATVTTPATGMLCIPITSGNYRVCEGTVTCWVSTTPPCVIVTVPPCGSTTAVFGNSSTGTLCVFKFNDVNCNGVQDAGEPPIAGWNFTVTRPNGTTFTLTTGTAGLACVPTTCGTYRICEELRTCWLPTRPECQDITVVPCQTVTATFANSSTGTLCIRKFEDLNGNGVPDPGEPFLAGWQFNVPGVGIVTTDATGMVCVRVTCGTYTVCEILQPGWVNTTPICQTVTVAPCASSLLVFGNRRICTGTICIRKFNDINCNGVVDPGEPAIPNWTFTITNGVVSATVTTDQTGTTCATVTTGTWTVCETLKPGWINTSPLCQTVTLTCTVNMANLVFTNSSTGTLCVRKFNDVNCNGIHDSGEPLVPNWPFTIFSTTGTVLATGTTSSSGMFCLPFTSGTYRVCEGSRPCWRPTTPTCVFVTVPPCGSTTAVFGNSSTGTLCVFKFNDINCNGVQDPGEPPIAGWNFTVTRPDGTTFTLTTGTAGQACVPTTCGNYVVCEEQRPCWAPTTPVCVDVFVEPCLSVTARFGNSSTGTLCILKFEDLNGNGIQDPGEPPLAGWQFNIPGVGIVITDPTGMVCIPLVCGTYTICEIMQPGWVNTTPICQTVNIVPCVSTLLLFGNMRQPCTATICGTKYWERVHGGQGCNGILDPDETGLAFWDIVVTDIGTGWTTTVTTDINGNYCVTVPAPGTYVVSEIIKWGFAPSFPAGGSYPPIVVNCGDVITGMDFLNCPCKNSPVNPQCQTDSIHVLSNPAVFNGNTVLVSAPGGVPLGNGVVVPVGAPAVPGALWIGPAAPLPHPVNPVVPYVWQRYFCTCDSTVIRIRLCFKGVNRVVVVLNGMVLGTYGPFPIPTPAPTCIDTTVRVGPGCHALEFRVFKTVATTPAAGLSYNGSIVGPGLIADNCCDCYRRHVPANVPPGLKQNDPNDHGRDSDATPGDRADEASPATTDMRDQMVSFDPMLTTIPNPANGATTVYYTLPQNLDVLLELYNSVGRHVQTLVNGHQEEGRHTVPLNMAEVPSGFYHLRLTAGGRVYTLRLINSK